MGFEPRYREVQLISSFIKCVSGLVSFVSGSVSLVLGEKPHEYWIFYAETPKKSGVSGKLECVGKMRQNPHFWKELRKERKEQRITRQYKDSHTGKSDFERCIAMNNEAINWDDVPDRITKDQLYRICYISKSTARYLLQSGKIPCYYTGKQTRCYQIKKEDVIAYLEDRKLFPQAYAAPEGLVQGALRA